MCKEVALPSRNDYVADTYPYRVAKGVQDVVAMMEFVAATRTEQLALVTITLSFPQRSGRGSRVSHVERSLRYFLENLRALVRKTDSVMLLGHTFYFILPGSDVQGGSIVQERLWDALLRRVRTITELDVLPPESISIGHSAYPAPSAAMNQCITAASVARATFESEQPAACGCGLKVVREGGWEAVQLEDEGLSALACKLGVPYLALLPRKLPTKVWKLVSPSLAQELHCYPLGHSHNVLTVAMADPRDSQALERLRQETGLSIFPVLAPSQELETVLEQLV